METEDDFVLFLDTPYAAQRLLEMTKT
jgi:hypothetical protein